MSVDYGAAGVEIPVTKGVETKSDVVTKGVVIKGVLTEEVTLSNGELSSEEVTTDDEGSLIEDKLEDDVGFLIVEGTFSEEVVGEGGICFLFRYIYIQRPRQRTPPISPTLGVAACVC